MHLRVRVALLTLEVGITYGFEIGIQLQCDKLTKDCQWLSRDLEWPWPSMPRRCRSNPKAGNNSQTGGALALCSGAF